MNDSEPFTLATFQASRERIAAHIRATPLIDASPVRNNPAAGARLLLKLENLQTTGSFKVRGATNTLLRLAPAQQRAGLVTASSGNHGLGVACAAAMAGTSAAIYLPDSASDMKVSKLESWGAAIHRVGSVWDEANAVALTRAAEDGLTYIHPFADPSVIHGQGTLALEILDQAPEVDTLLISVGGGGLIAGVATAAKAKNPKVRILGVEPEGAPTHYRSRVAGTLVTLDEITTRAGSLAPRRSDPLNFDLINRHVADIILVSDADMEQAARWLWQEFAIAAELSGAAAVAALRAGAVAVKPGSTVCAVICGAGTDGFG